MRVVALVVITACSYAPSPAGPSTAADAMPDGLPATCDTLGERACDGRLRRECGSDHMWNPALDVTCDFTCVAGECVAASNVPATDVAACGSSAPRLAPPAGGAVQLDATGINCTPHCGDSAVTTIAPTLFTDPTPDLAWFCLSSIDLATGVNVTVAPGGGPVAAVAFLVDGPIEIASMIDISGGTGSPTVGGKGAPGGFDGGGFSNVDGVVGGGGACGGHGGQSKLSPDEAGAGGGGGGYAISGASGGNGRDAPNTTTVIGGTGGTICGDATLIPLLGGAGGGGGGDGTCNMCGWPGGGGGGALQLSSRVSITIGGVVRARGGVGYGEVAVAGGGGGGGAGGALLLEAPSVIVTGQLDVDGGRGGTTNAGQGGAGATGGAAATNGASFGGPDQAGAGGGGAGGRIRVDAPNASCTNTTPIASCAAGMLVVVP